MVWLGILLAGVGTYALRAMFLVRRSDETLASRLTRALSFVAPAALAAMVVSSVAKSADAQDALLRTGALVVAGVVAFRTRSVIITIGAGMVTLWLLSWWLG